MYDLWFEFLEWSEILFDNKNFTPSIIKHYFTKHNINSIEDIETAKSKMLEINPDNTFDVHSIDHLFESPPEFV